MHHSKNAGFIFLVILLLATFSQAISATSPTSGTEWNLYSQFWASSDVWSYGYVAPNDWSGSYTPTTLRTESGIWLDPTDKGQLLWYDNGSVQQFLPGAQGLFFMPGGTNDHIIAFKAPVSGKYTVSGSIYRSGQVATPGDGIEFSIYGSAFNRKEFAFYHEIIVNTGKEFKTEIILAKDQNVILRVGRHLHLYFDNQTILSAAVTLNKILDDASALTQSQKPVAPIQLGDEKVTLSMSPTGSIVSLTDSEAGCQVIVNKDTPAWTIRTDWLNNDTRFSSDNYPAPKVYFTGTKLCYKWERADSPSILGTVFFDKAKRNFHFAVDITNNTSQRIDEISWPGAISIPIDSGNYGIWANGQVSTNMAIVEPLNKLPNTTLVYPGHLLMQMLGYKIGDSSLLVYTNDNKALVKTYHMTRDNDTLTLESFQQMRLKSGDKWTHPYEVILKAIPHGSYNELAREYGEWGRKQWWAKVTAADKLKRTPLIKDYTQYGFIRFQGTEADYKQQPDGLYTYTGPKDSGCYNKQIAFMKKFRTDYGISPGYWDAGWSGHKFDSHYPDYFPTGKYMGDFTKYRNELISNKFPMMYHINMAQWVTTAPSHNESFMAIYKGKPYYQTWSNLKHALTSPALTLKRDMETINAVKDKAGVNGAYLDVIGWCFLIDENPNSPFADKPNCYELAKMQTFKTVRNAISGPIMTEGTNEIELPYIDFGFGCSGHPWYDTVPMWEMVYGDRRFSINFIDRSGEEEFQNQTWLVGGSAEVNTDSAGIYEISAKQGLVSRFAGRRIERFDRAGEFRASHWKTGVVVVRKNSAIPQQQDFHTLSVLGPLDFTGVGNNGCAILTDETGFSFNNINKLTSDDKPLFDAGAAHINITHNGKRWVIRNRDNSPSDLTFKLSPKLISPKTRLIAHYPKNRVGSEVTFKQENGVLKSSILHMKAGETIVLRDK